MKTILFICTGNVCRSPMAEALFRRAAAGRGEFRVLSAGLGAVDGQPPTAHSVTAMLELGIDISSQRSRMLTTDLVREADYIFGMTRSHVDAIALLYPQVAEKTFLLREFDDTVEEFEKDIPDPIGSAYTVYEHCRDQIQQGIASLLKFMEQHEILSAPPAAKPAVTTNFALGADHGGFELKEALKQHLQQRGLSVADFGAKVKDPADDYPDFARPVAHAVAGGQAELGLLVCTSGIGVSMTANKVPGARAALAADEPSAALARQHNNANILCLSGKNTPPELGRKILDAFIAAKFEGGRHERRVNKMEVRSALPALRLSQVDSAVAESIEHERLRQQENIELIASENFVSPAVLEAQGSVLTNKYAEGYSGKRYYGGCEFVDVVENLAVSRVKQLFGADWANVQAHSGSQANAAAYMAMMEPGQTVLGMSLDAGGHLTHGAKVNFSGKMYHSVQYGLNPKTGEIDYEALRLTAQKEKPKVLLAGFSAYPRGLDWAKIAAIAKEVGAVAMADVAHIAGLIAGGAAENPFDHGFDIMTTTTHKTLRGPRGGMILVRESDDVAKKVDKAVFPGLQGGPHMHQIAAKAVALGEASRASFKTYAREVVTNAQAMAEVFSKSGVRLIGGGTDNHLILADVSGLGLSGGEAEKLLDSAGITVNKNMIAGDTRTPSDPSGIRFGSPALTTRGFGKAESARIAELMIEVLKNRSEATSKKVGAEVRERSLAHPVPDSFA